MKSHWLAAAATILTLSPAIAVTPAWAAGAIVSTPVRSTYIYMTHRPSRDVAIDLAISTCEHRYGGGCQVVASYNSGCMAIAQSHDGSHHSGWAVKPSMNMAQRAANGQCEKYGDPCTIDVAVCE